MARHYRKWPARQGIDCYRLFDRDTRGVPLAVDRYGDCLLIAVYEKASAPFAPRREQWIEHLTQSAGAGAGRRAGKRVRQTASAADRGRSIRAARKRAPRMRRQRGRFEVRGQPFRLPRHRPLPRSPSHAVRGARRSAGKAVSQPLRLHRRVHGVRRGGGAASTTTVDLSKTYLLWAQRNLRLNEIRGPQHRLVRHEARQVPRRPSAGRALRSGGRRSAYVLAQQAPRARLGHPARPRRTAQPAIKVDGARRHDLLLDEFPPLSPGGGSPARRRDPRDHAANHPPDFRHRRIHRCWRMQVRP